MAGRGRPRLTGPAGLTGRVSFGAPARFFAAVVRRGGSVQRLGVAFWRGALLRRSAGKAARGDGLRALGEIPDLTLISGGGARSGRPGEGSGATLELTAMRPA